MSGVNKCIFVGNLGRDPEARFAQSGTAITKMNLAVSESYKDANGERRDRTEWVRLTAFGKQAEIMGQYLSKGSKIYVEGRMQTSKYTDKDGQEKWSTEIVVKEFQFLDKKGENSGSSGGGQGGGGQGGDGFFDDDLGF